MTLLQYFSIVVVPYCYFLPNSEFYCVIDRGVCISDGCLDMFKFIHDALITVDSLFGNDITRKLFTHKSFQSFFGRLSKD